MSSVTRMIANAVLLTMVLSMSLQAQVSSQKSAGDLNQPSTKQRMLSPARAKDLRAKSLRRSPARTVGVLAPGNDFCSSATPIVNGTFAGDTVAATNDGSESCVGSTSNDIWFLYTASADGTIVASTSGSDFDTVLSVHDPLINGCPGDPSDEIVCDDDGGGSATSKVSWTVVSGRSYLIRVGGYDISSSGNVVLTVAAASGISGTISDSGTLFGLASVGVDLFDSNGSFAGWANTDNSGAYLFPDLLPGSYYLTTYNDQGYIDELYNNIQCPSGNCDVTSGTSISVSSGAITGNINLALSSGGQISGNITDSSTGAPIPYAWVDVFDSNGFVAWGFSDESGNYTSQTGLPNGTYYAGLDWTQGYYQEVYNNVPCNTGCWPPDDGAPISVVAPSTTTGIDFTPAPWPFIDDFEDGDASNWTFVKGTWGVDSGILTGTVSKKGDAFSPNFVGCQECAIESAVEVQSAGSKVSIYGWYQDKSNYVELMLMESKNKILLKQRSGGKTIIKKSFSMPVNPGDWFYVYLAYDGSNYSVYVNGYYLNVPASSAPSPGKIGFRVKSTTGLPTTAGLDYIATY